MTLLRTFLYLLYLLSSPSLCKALCNLENRACFLFIDLSKPFVSQGFAWSRFSLQEAFRRGAILFTTELKVAQNLSNCSLTESFFSSSASLRCCYNSWRNSSRSKLLISQICTTFWFIYMTFFFSNSNESTKVITQIRK